MRVLIAEDSAVARVMLERALSSLGHECIVAQDGDRAWELFERGGADVVISDWLMPGIDGDELCRRVRSSSSDSYTYFILLTSLADQGHVVQGMCAGADDYLKKPFEHGDLEARLIAAARVTALYERLNAQQAEMEQLNRRLFEESRTDPLTRIGNRIALREHLAQLSGGAARYGHRYSVALYDLDNFKSFNDTHGHLAGDAVLRQVAHTLAKNCRAGDAVYRYGGEELLIVLPEQTIESATFATERVRAAVQELAIARGEDSPDVVLTVSAGVAQLEPDDDGDFEAVLKRADIALYRAKALGRNRVEAGVEDPVAS